MKRLGVTFVNRSCALVSGHGSRELIIEIKGRPPVWSNAGRAWVVQPHTARDAIAQAERRGYVVVIEQPEPEPVRPAAPAVKVPTRIKPQGSLW